MSEREFAVVEFEEVKDGKKAVELIPTLWLSDDETFCLWPPKNMEKKFQMMVKMKNKPGELWQKYPVKIITIAKDYEQGLRRLKRSLKKKDVDSTETESQDLKDDQPSVLSSATVSQLLADPTPLKNKKHQPRRSQSADALKFIENGSGDDEFGYLASRDLGTPVPRGITNYDELAQHLRNVIHVEMCAVRKSVNYHIGQKFKQIMEILQYSAEPPSCKQQAWKNIGENLPFEDIETFMSFDESLKNSEEKQKAMNEIFQMITAGSTTCEEDVQKILGKLLKKEIQLQYSGSGKKTKGVGKKPFKDTETYKEMEKFLTAKYKASKKPLLTAVSSYLAGAKDRDGGRADRSKKN